jgi:hypothetical protein
MKLLTNFWQNTKLFNYLIMNITSKKIFEVIKNTFSTPSATLDELIGNALSFLMEPPPSEIQEAELIEQFRDGVKREINKFIKDCKLRHVPPDYEFGITDNFVINKKSSIHDANHEFFKWLSEISPTKFEFICKKILEIEGCDNVYVTQPSADGGVDFWGTKKLMVVDDNNAIIFRQVELLIFGQAKRYSYPIGIVELRHFLGTFNLIKLEGLQNAPDCLPKVLKEISINPLSPILLIFITSGEFNENAKEIARWLGIRLIAYKELFYLFFKNRLGFSFYGNTVKFDPSTLEDIH